MLNNKKFKINFSVSKSITYASIILFLILLSFPNVSSREYSLTLMNESIYIYSNGTVHVNENIEYHFSGCWHEVYREITLHGMRIENIKVMCKGAYCKPEKDFIGDKVIIRGFLYPDEKSSLNEVCDRIVTFQIDYDLSKVIKIYYDASEFHYKLWGEEWDKSLGQLHAKIYLPEGDGNVSYWFHSVTKENAVYDSSKNYLDVRTSSIPANKYFEVRLVMPKEWFNESSKHIWYISKNGTPEILKIEQDYENRKIIFSILSILIPLIIIPIAIFIPFLIYYRYGREPRINYEGIYERELPYNDPPAVVNAIVRGKIGKPTMDAFTSTIMDLGRRKYINISTKKINVKGFVFDRIKENIVIEFTDKSKTIVDDVHYKTKIQKDEKKIDFFGFNLLNFINFDFSKNNKITEIKINKNIGKKINNLTDFEYYSLVFLAGFSNRKDGKDMVLWQEVENKLKKKSIAVWFLKFYSDWNDLAEDHITMNEIFVPKGNTYLKIYGVIAIIIVFFTFIITLSVFEKITSLIGISFVLLFASALISLVMPEKIGGRWTPDGRTYYEKWKAFEHFLTDFSQMKRYPPESIVLWEHYIVYATTLGIADKVIENMRLMLPKEEVKSMGIYAHPAAMSSFNHAFRSGISTATASSGGGGFGGGVGGAGGGFGGGGGGAR